MPSDPTLAKIVSLLHTVSPEHPLSTRQLARAVDLSYRHVRDLATSPVLAPYRRGSQGSPLRWARWPLSTTDPIPTVAEKIPETVPKTTNDEQEDKILCQQSTITRLESECKKLRLTLATRREEARIVAGAVPAISIPSTGIHTKKNRPGDSNHTLLVALSDWHLGEVVSLEETGGINEYNYEIAREGLLDIVTRIIKWVEIQRLGYNIPNIQILGLGDWISGDIHEELTATNEFPAPVAAARAGALLAEAVGTLVQHFSDGLAFCDVIAGNHDRLSHHTPSKKTNQSSLSYLVGTIAKESLRNINHLTFTLHEDPMPLIAIQGRNVVFAHGHQIRASGNSPYYGIARRAASLQQQHGRVDHLILGHFHHAAQLNDQQVIMVPSLIGSSEWSMQMGFSAKPGQWACLVGEHGIHGSTVFERRS